MKTASSQTEPGDRKSSPASEGAAEAWQAVPVSPPFLEALFRSSPDLLVVVDEQGRIVFTNDRCKDLLGFEPGELLGKPIAVLIPAQYGGHAELCAAYRRQPLTRAMGKGPVLRARHKSGSLVPVDICLSPLPPFPGHGRLVQAVIRDGRPRWRVQQDLLVQSVAMEAATNGIVITDLAGIVQWVNPAVTRMTGYSRSEMLGQPIRLLKSNQHDAAFYRELWQTILAGQAWFGEMANRRKDGTIYFEEQHIAPVRDEHGELTHFIAIKQNVTARKQAEKKLQEASDELTRRLGEISALQQQLREQATRDPLTNLFNRRYLHETLNREVIRGHRDALDLSVILIDVDDFKQVNDLAGHAAGDIVLTTLAELLTAGIRGTDFACRLGGDEFLLLLPGASLATAAQRAGELRRAFARGHQAEPGGRGPSACTLSLGVAQLRMDGETTEALLGRADQALYRAKQEGRNRVVAIP